MPLEDQIASLTLAINNLAAAFAGRVVSAPAEQPAAPEAEKPVKTKKEKPAATVTPEVVPDLPTEEQMMAAGQRILDKGQKPKIAELNKKFGIERGRELFKDPAKSAQLADYYKQLLAIADAA